MKILNNISQAASRVQAKLTGSRRDPATGQDKSDQTETRKKIVVLTQFYAPEPMLYPETVAKSLRDAGYEVEVVTGYPNRPGGKLYPEYRQRWRYSETRDGIPVHRVPLIINHSRKAVERIANFLSFSFSALSATRVIKGADAVYVYATPATAAIPAQIWKSLLGVPYVLHVQDLWPESVTDSGMMGQGKINRAAKSLLDPWLRRLYGNAEKLIAISPGMQKLLIDRGNAANRCAVVYNWAHEDWIETKTPETFTEHGLRLLYAGNLGPMQDLETLIEAAKIIGSAPGFKLQIAGNGILEDQLKQSAQGLTNTEFLGRLPREEISKVYLTSDFQLVTLKDIPIFRTTVPSKLQASLAAGVPVITTVKGDVADLIQQYNAGIVAEPEDYESLANAIKRALEMSATERAAMGANARKLYIQEMSQASGTAEIVKIFDNVIGTDRINSTEFAAVAVNETIPTNVTKMQDGTP